MKVTSAMTRLSIAGEEHPNLYWQVSKQINLSKKVNKVNNNNNSRLVTLAIKTITDDNTLPRNRKIHATMDHLVEMVQPV